jgi:hypothetical protein
VTINENITEQKRVNVSEEQADLTVLDNSRANIDKCGVYGNINMSEIYMFTDVVEHGNTARIF